MKALERKTHNKIPTYGKNGSAKSFGKYILITIGLIVILLGLLVLAIHVPAILYKEQPKDEVSTVEFAIKPDETAIRSIKDYLKDHPSEDFDNDGLPNSEELKYGTDSRNPDTDLDGVCDYAEIHIDKYAGRPTQKGTVLQDRVSELLRQNNVSVGTPFKIHDVIMWADNLTSRSAGTVIPTIRGYRFKNFNGWVQFSGTVYAYRLDENHHHISLQYKEKENAWRIESEQEDVEVVLYNAPLEKAHVLELFGKNYYVDPSWISDVFDIILPKEHSFVNFRDLILQDTYDYELAATVTEPIMPKIDKTDMSRFGKATYDFEDLTKVYTSIKSGRTVAVSLQSPTNGEVIGMIYGFTDYGDLLFADGEGNKTSADGKEYMLDIKEQSAITIDHNGELCQREYFDFCGLGFNSENGDKICFIFTEK